MRQPVLVLFFFFQAEDGIRDADVTGVQTCALPILAAAGLNPNAIPSERGAAGFLAQVTELGRQAEASLERARRHVTKLPREATIAVLPLALVSTYVRASEGAEGSSPPRGAYVAPLNRVLRIAGAHWFGR